MMPHMRGLGVKIFADGADIAGIVSLAEDPIVKGFTTNPTLMRAAGVSDYVAFAHRVLQVVTEAPISFEVFSDEFADMERPRKRAVRLYANGQRMAGPERKPADRGAARRSAFCECRRRRVRRRRR